ncbi:MAG: alpha/beta hydrolase [Bacteroidales bacterium]|nr:alpha/beta hydrolase [Bacteroidales bacterium]
MWILTSMLILAQFSICHAQQKRSDFTIGDKISFDSKVLNERKTIVVIPPYNYKDRPDEKFPVVYVLDPGNNLFATFGIVNYYSDMLKIMPRMIIVGIVSNDREKDYLPSPSEEQPTGGGADKFLQFISSELVALIDSTYPSNSERCIIGHSAGGLFAIYALENEPELFNSFICIDPSLWYDDQSFVKKIPDFLKNNKDIKKSIFISLSNEKEMGVFSFVEMLEKYAPDGLKWDYVHYKSETHNSLGFKSICAGFEMIYKDWGIDDKEN